MNKNCCAQFHEFLDEWFEYFNIPLRRDSDKVLPRYYCKNRQLPRRKVHRVGTDSQEYILVERKYSNGYPNGAGKRENAREDAREDAIENTMERGEIN